MKILFAATAALGVSAAFAADDPRVLSAVELKERAAKPVIIVAPTYPEAAVREGREGTVDVAGTVSAGGILEDAKMTGASDDFIAAVREVMPFWRFTPLYGVDDCEPKPAPGAVRVWFEMKGGKPAISVSRGTAPTAGPEGSELPRELKALKRIEPRYPQAAIRAGRAGDVEALVLIDDKGDVKSVTIVPSTTPALFGEEVAHALRQWKFEPPAGGKPVCASYDIQFRLHG